MVCGEEVLESRSDGTRDSAKGGAQTPFVGRYLCNPARAPSVATRLAHPSKNFTNDSDSMAPGMLQRTES